MQKQRRQMWLNRERNEYDKTTTTKTSQHLQPKTKLIGDHLWKIIAMLSVIANYTLLILGTQRQQQKAMTEEETKNKKRPEHNDENV
jgi:hypothetical protein